MSAYNPIDDNHYPAGRRVLVVCSSWFRADGGLYEYFLAWIDHLRREGRQVGAIAAEPILNTVGGDVPLFRLPIDRDDARYYKALAISSLPNWAPANTFCESLLGSIREFQPDIVHITDLGLHTGFLVERVARSMPGVLVIQTVHDPKRHEERISIPALVLAKLNDRRLVESLKHPNVYLHVHQLDLAKGSCFDYPSRLIEMPAPKPRQLSVRQRPPIIDRPADLPLRMGFVGRIEHYKGLDVLHTALKELLSNGDIAPEKIEVLIAGRGDLNNADWRSLPVSVELRNEYLTDQDFHRLVSNLDLLVLPYRSATHTGVGLMATSYGIPIIATAVGAIPERIVKPGKNGFLVAPGDAQQLAERLKQVINDPASLQQIAEGAQALVASAISATEEMP